MLRLPVSEPEDTGLHIGRVVLHGLYFLDTGAGLDLYATGELRTGDLAAQGSAALRCASVSFGAANVAAIGATCRLVGAVGDDSHAEAIRAELVTARAEARKLDQHGRDTHPVYKQSAPLQGP